MWSTRLHRLLKPAVAIMGAVGLVLSSAATASAAVPITVISTDPYTNTTSYHQTQVEPDTYSFGSTIVAAFQSGRFSDGGSSNLGYSTSTNNGASWTSGFLPGTTVYATPAGTWARISDPTVSYDAKHNVWIIIGLVLDANVSARGLVASRSTDAGLTFQNPVTVSLNQGFYDKQWMTCDDIATSPFYGNCYAEWAGNTGVVMSRSTDGGLTWAMSSTPSNGGTGGQPVVTNNGTVVVPFVSFQMQSLVSTNGGVSYTGPNTISSASDHGVAGSLRTELLPSAEVDGAGKVYLVWQDCRFRTGCSANDVVMSTSTDGVSWTPVVRIPIDAVTSTADHFIPAIAADKATSGATAHLTVAFYFYPQANCTASTCALQAASIGSRDGGATWGGRQKLTHPMHLTWLPFTTLGYMVGDYVSVSYGSNGRAYPVVAQADTTTNCTTAQLGSCHEYMVAPTNGLAPVSGGTRVDPNERVVYTGRALGPRGLTLN